MKKQNKNKARQKKTQKQRPTTLRRSLHFLPAFAISLFATLLWTQPLFASVRIGGPGVLAKATNTSVSGLLSATNAQRSANGVATLTLNSKLNSAAQAKAADMVNRGYWAHVTPDGKQPWWFIANAGYQYTSAGENLAYGFSSSDSTITGWMNSSSHRTNMLNATFTEVGFGIVDTDNYVYNDPQPDGPSTDHGPQTIVVAMYAKPQASAPPAQQSSSPPATQQSTTQNPTASAKPAETTPAPAPEEAAAPIEEPAEEKIKDEKEPIAVADTQTTTAAPTKVSRVQLLTGGAAIWSATFVLLAVCAAAALWFMHKGMHLKRYILAGEKFLAHHHIHLDLTVLSIIYLGFVLLSTSGTIR